jgi:stage III sporulation protein SpoIIIAA
MVIDFAIKRLLFYRMNSIVSLELQMGSLRSGRCSLIHRISATGVPRQVTISNINSATADIKRFHFKSRHFISEYRLYNNVQFLILCGQPGVGKGTAAQYFRIGARERGLHQTIHLVAKSKHRNIPYAILRDLFLELVGNDNFKSSIQQVSLLKGLIFRSIS